MVIKAVWMVVAVLSLMAITGFSGVRGEDDLRFRDLTAKFFDEGNGKDLAQAIGLKMPVKQVRALEYKILLFSAGKEVAIDPKIHPFQIGDRVRVAVAPWNKSHVYIFHVGASGKHQFLLPREGRQPPLVEARTAVTLPTDGYFEFVEPPGEEKLIVVAAEKPVGDLAVLERVLVKGPDEPLTREERQVQAVLNATVEGNLKSVQGREAELRDKTVKFRGLLNGPDRQALANDVRTRGVASGTIEARPEKAGEGTIAMYISIEAGNEAAPRSNLLVTIPLRSVAATGGAGK